MQLELLALSHVEAWENIEKPQGDMAFLLIVPGKTIEGGDGIWAGHGVDTPIPSMTLFLG